MWFILSEHLRLGSITMVTLYENRYNWRSADADTEAHRLDDCFIDHMQEALAPLSSSIFPGDQQTSRRLVNGYTVLFGVYLRRVST